MIRIAICDDDPKKGEAVAAYIETCMREWGVPHETQFFLESQYLYYEIEDGVLFDVLNLPLIAAYMISAVAVLGAYVLPIHYRLKSILNEYH